MTNAEFKKKIAEATEQEWYKTISVDFCFRLNPRKIIGLTAIYEFVNMQIDGWSKYSDLPNELNKNKDNFTNIKTAILSFVNTCSEHTAQTLDLYWSGATNWNRTTNATNATNATNVINVINTCINDNLLPYEIPEIGFLVNVYENTPNYFFGAYDFIVNKSSHRLNTSDNFYGAILAYEFTLKDTTEISNRRNAEKKSISQIRNDFQKYLSESEQQITTHLSNANTKFAEYVEKINELKDEKEKLFLDWFENTKNELWQKWFEQTTNNLVDLENDYKEKKEELEKIYHEKLKLEAPAKYWDERATKLKNQGWVCLGIIVVLIIFGCWFFSDILLNPYNVIFTGLFDNDKATAIKGTLIYITLISFWVYCIRTLSKVMFSSFHLARDCDERHTLTYFYLSLLKDASVDNDDRKLIMQSLFSRADTGLLKEDSSPAMPNDIVSKIIGSRLTRR